VTRRQSRRNLLLLVSLMLFPVTLYYLSPYLIIMGGAMGILTGSAVVFLAMFVSSLAFGRAFCGWICPAGALQEGCAKAVGKPSKAHAWLKYALWVPWLLGIALAFVRAGGMKELDFFFMTDHGISASGVPGYMMYFTVVLVIMALALLFGRRSMCRAVCWMAPFMVLGELLRRKLRLPGLRLMADGENCIGCGACEKNCPMSLPVRGMAQKRDMRSTECILCGRCADGCPKMTLSLRFRGGAAHSPGESSSARTSAV
jgi:polyferredoxin